MVQRIIGILIFLIGAGGLFGAKYIRDQVGIGKEKIASAQKKVDEGSGLFNFNPVAKQISKGAKSSAQEKINEGIRTVEYYENVANWLQVGGIAFLIIGTGVVFIHKKKK